MHDDIEEYEPNEIDEFIEKVEIKGSKAFSDIPNSVYEHTGTLQLLCDMGHLKDVMEHAPEELKNNHDWVKGIVTPYHLNEEDFLEYLEEEGSLMFYEVHPEIFNKKEFLIELAEMGYVDEVKLHMPANFKNDTQLMSELEKSKVVSKTITVEKEFHTKDTPEDGFDNVWGQRESHEHYRAILTIDEQKFVFNKYVSFMPLRETDEVMMTVQFTLNDKHVASANILFDEELKIQDHNAFALLRKFKLDNAQTPEIQSFEVKLFEKKWDTIMNVENKSTLKM